MDTKSTFYVKIVCQHGIDHIRWFRKKWYPHNQDCFGLTSRLLNLKLMFFFLSVLTLKHFKAVCSPVDALKLSIVFCVKILLKIGFFFKMVRWSWSFVVCIDFL